MSTLVYTDGKVWWTGDPRNAIEHFRVTVLSAKVTEVLPLGKP